MSVHQLIQLLSASLSLFLHIVSVESLNSTNICDFKKYSSGCEDSVGSQCNHTSNQCGCRPDFDVSLADRFCLKLRAVSESCFTSKQCLNGSKCFSNSTELFTSNTQFWIRADVPLSPEGLCVCPQTHFANKENVCERHKSIGQSCEEDSQCLQPNSVCNTTKQCVCELTYVFSSVIGHCVKGKYLGEECSGREECRYSEEYSWCIDNICMCGAGYTPDKTSYNGLPQCVLDTMIVERVVPETVPHNKTEPSFDYMTLLLIFGFLIAFIIAIGIARRNRNSIMQMIRPSSDVNTNGYCDQSSHRMIPIDNTINSFNTSDIAINSDHNCKQNNHSNNLLPNISIESQKTY